ncbi:MAG: LysM peptidoglycan-binding domain-containing protein [Actinomycetota bacterium]
MTAAISTAHYHTVLPAPMAQVYVRRRLLVVVVLVVTLLALWVGAGNVLANRGGVPASAAAVRPASVYVVHAGDTLWSIASAHRGHWSIDGYVDLLQQANGGTHLQIGQQLSLP